MAAVTVTQVFGYAEVGLGAKESITQVLGYVEIGPVLRLDATQVFGYAEVGDAAALATTQVFGYVEMECLPRREGSGGHLVQTQRIHELIAEPQTGYVLNPRRSFFALVVPTDAVNLVSNPECVDLFGYSGVGCSVSSSIAEQRRGLRSLYVEAVIGGRVRCALAGELSANTHYTFAVDLKGRGRYALAFGDAYGNPVTPYKTVVGTEFWHRHDLTEYLLVGASSLLVASLDGTNFNLDGWQCEKSIYATTFISGNLEAPADTTQAGVMAYGWAGVPHRSASFRTRYVLDAGRPIPLNELGLEVTGFSGLGYAAPELLTTKLARSGSLFGGLNLVERSFSISGIIRGNGIMDVLTKRGQLGGLGGTTPLLLQVQFYDDADPISEVAEIECAYAGGLEGNFTGLYQERAVINFRTWRPALRLLGNRAQELNTETVTQADSFGTIIYRDGTVGSMPGAADWDDAGDLPARFVVAHGVLYATQGRYLMRYTGTSWDEAFDAGAGASVADAIHCPDGLLAIIYTNGATGGIVRWNPITLTHNHVGDAAFATTAAVMVMSRLRLDVRNNLLYICGNFTSLTLGGAPAAGAFDGVCYLNLRTLTFGSLAALYGDSADVPAHVKDVAIDSRSRPWIVGEFKNVAASTRCTDGEAWGIALYEDAAWLPGMYPTALGSGMLLSASEEHAIYAADCWLLNDGSSTTIELRGMTFDGENMSWMGNYSVPEELLGAGQTIILKQTGQLRKVVSRPDAYTVVVDEAIDLAMGPGPMGGHGAPGTWTYTANGAEITSVIASAATCIAYDEQHDTIFVGGDFYSCGRHDSNGRKLLTDVGQAFTSIDANFRYHSPVTGLANLGTIAQPIVNDMLYSPATGLLHVVGGFDNIRIGIATYVPATGYVTYAPATLIMSAPHIELPPLVGEFEGLPENIYDHWGYALLDVEPQSVKSAYAAIDLPDFAQWYGELSFGFVIGNGGALYVSHMLGPVAVTPTTIVDFPTNANIRLRLEVTGPCTFQRLINAVNGRVLEPQLSVAANETVIFSLDPLNPWIRSSRHGALTHPRLGLDNYPDLGFVPGRNYFLLELVEYEAAAGAGIYWSEEYAAVDAIVERYA